MTLPLSKNIQKPLIRSTVAISKFAFEPTAQFVEFLSRLDIFLLCMQFREDDRCLVSRLSSFPFSSLEAARREEGPFVSSLDPPVCSVN